jgi:hypothetical protein
MATIGKCSACGRQVLLIDGLCFRCKDTEKERSELDRARSEIKELTELCERYKIALEAIYLLGPNSIGYETARQALKKKLSKIEWKFGWYVTKSHATVEGSRRGLCGAEVMGPNHRWTRGQIKRISRGGDGKCKNCLKLMKESSKDG